MGEEAESVPKPTTGGSDAPEATAPQPAMGEHCATDRPLPTNEAPTGEIVTLSGVEVDIGPYIRINGSNEYNRLLLFLTNGVGIKSTNNQLQADKFASEGFLVVMPDLFAGDIAPNTTAFVPEAQPEETTSTIEQIKLHAAAIVSNTTKSFGLDMWLARHTPETTMPVLEKVVEQIKGEYADAVSYGGGIYAVGYCYGAKYVLVLCGSHTPATQANQGDVEQGEVKAEPPLVKAGALAHATSVTVEDMASVKSPVSIICIEDDQLFPDEIREQGKKHLEENKITHELEIYSGVPHGFAVLGQYADQGIQDAQKRAFDQMLKWIKEH